MKDKMEGMKYKTEKSVSFNRKKEHEVTKKCWKFNGGFLN